MRTHACGCVTYVDATCGATRSRLKCSKHMSKMRAIELLDLAYYRELGALDDENTPMLGNYIKEFVAGFGELPDVANGRFLEIGCGCSPYVGYVLSKGYEYVGLDASEAATTWLRSQYGVQTITGDFDDADVAATFDVIFAAHSLEHMPDAVVSLRKMYHCLRSGGSLYILVPDDSDLFNPDHLWFFNESTLCSALRLSGFEQIDSAKTVKVVPRENFVYVKAVKL